MEQHVSAYVADWRRISIIGGHLGRVFASKRIAQITPSDAERYARILAWAYHRGLSDANPLEKIGRLYKGTRADKVWTSVEEQKFLASAGAELALAFIMGVESGQREGDLLVLPWAACETDVIYLRQNKTGARVALPISRRLRTALDAAPVILTNTKGHPWSGGGFGKMFGKARDAAGVDTELRFQDLRGTFITRKAIEGWTHAQIAAVSGHSLRQVGDIIDRHYLSRDALMADESGTGL